jgi:hypothetical protein
MSKVFNLTNLSALMCGWSGANCYLEATKNGASIGFWAYGAAALGCCVVGVELIWRSYKE